MIRLFKHQIPHVVVVLAYADLLILLFAGELAWHIASGQLTISLGHFLERICVLGFFAVAVEAAIFMTGGYRTESLRSVTYASARIIAGLGLSVVFLAIVNLLLPGEILAFTVLALALLLALPLLVLSRLVLGPLFKTTEFRRKIVVLGSGQKAQALYELSLEKQSSFTATAFVKMSDGPSHVDGAMLRSSIAELGGYVERRGAQEVVLAMREHSGPLPLTDILTIKGRGLAICTLTSFLERETGRVDLAQYEAGSELLTNGFSIDRMVRGACKRTFDVAVSATTLFFTWPLIAVFAVMNKSQNEGQLFNRQEHLGLNGKPFDRLARRDSFTAQFWHVLKGDMSIVGPRPIASEHGDIGDDIQLHRDERHSVKPGLTGWAQIHMSDAARDASNSAPSRAELEYDLYYIKHRSVFLDCLILLRTMLPRRSSRHSTRYPSKGAL